MEMTWYYLSLASEDGWLGCAFLQKPTELEAVSLGRSLAPSADDIICIPTTQEEISEHVPPNLRGRLLSMEEAKTLGMVPVECL
jgi:hypothetical protein